jgi:hypothetical protein
MTQSLIINSPYEVPRQHWQQARDGSLSLVPERRATVPCTMHQRASSVRVQQLTNNIIQQDCMK